MNTVRPLPPTMHAPNGISYSVPSTSAVCAYDELFELSPWIPRWFTSSNFPFPCIGQPSTQSQNVTVVVENPMTVDDKGKLVSRLCALLPSANRSAFVLCVAQWSYPALLTPPVDIFTGEQRRSRGYIRREKVAKHVSTCTKCGPALCLIIWSWEHFVLYSCLVIDRSVALKKNPKRVNGPRQQKKRVRVWIIRRKTVFCLPPWFFCM